MGNNDLNEAKEENRRQKLLLGMKIDGGFEEEDETKLREGMFKRMKIMDDLEELRVLKEDLDQARDNHDIIIENLKDWSEGNKKKCDENNELHFSIEKGRKELGEIIQLKQDLSQKISEANNREREFRVEHSRSLNKWNNVNREFQSGKETIIGLQKEHDDSKKELDDIEKEYNEMESKFNPKKRKEMESSSGDFDVKIEI
jgi:chromosome segregation ATPase